MLTEPTPRPTSPPTAYVVEHHTQECRHCNRRQNYSAVYSFHQTTSVRRYVPVQRLEWNVPIEQRTAAITYIPICRDCFTAVTVSHLPTPPSLAEARVPLHVVGREPERPKGAAKEKRVCTIDDL